MSKSSIAPRNLGASRSFLESSSITIRSVTVLLCQARQTGSGQKANFSVEGNCNALA